MYFAVTVTDDEV